VKQLRRVLLRLTIANKLQAHLLTIKPTLVAPVGVLNAERPVNSVTHDGICHCHCHCHCRRCASSLCVTACFVWLHDYNCHYHYRLSVCSSCDDKFQKLYVWTDNGNTKMCRMCGEHDNLLLSLLKFLNTSANIELSSVRFGWFYILFFLKFEESLTLRWIDRYRISASESTVAISCKRRPVSVVRSMSFYLLINFVRHSEWEFFGFNRHDVIITISHECFLSTYGLWETSAKDVPRSSLVMTEVKG
jgi:hypothetical protein